jgi:sterol desaturase/sphingolipid hydroxylase (fatty acid hydroxylase superfamily)
MPVAALVPALFVTFIVLERLFPARPLVREPAWRLRGLTAFLLSGILATGVPLLYVGFARQHRLLDLERLGAIAGAGLAFLATELVGYWWHRARHDIPFLWRALHQMHHSAERVDIYGAFYSHPLDLIGVNLVGTAVATMLLGVSGEAAALAGLATVMLAMFQHANLRTPRWLGYIVQRPESHSVHHARGVHAGNYANLPLWDLIFRTFKNPEGFEAEAGFYDGASRRIGEMLVGLDVGRARPLIGPAGSQRSRAS